MPRRIQTNMSKGELSPLMESRPDLAVFYEGGRLVQNWNVMRQGGLDRRNGTRMIAEVKNSALDTIILPFETSVDDAYIVEVGNLYKRFFKNKAPIRISAGAPPLEIISPYITAQLRNIHFTQSVDIMFMFHRAVPQQKLAHVSDTSWSIIPMVYNPPPSFEADDDISQGGTVTPGAVTGSGITFTASIGVFLAADVGRQIIFGVSRATITGVTDASHVVCTIIDDFPNINPIPTGQWLIRLAPQTTLDPNAKAPVGLSITLVSGGGTVPAFHATGGGQFITNYTCLVKIQSVNSSTNITGIIMSEMTGTTAADPPAAPAGAWTLETVSWSVATGFPGTGEFYQGRLGQAGTIREPTTFWLSQNDNFD